MSDHAESLGRGRQSRLAAGVVTIALAVGLSAAGCAAAPSAPGGTSSQAPSDTSGPSGASDAGLTLNKAPGISGFGSPASTIAPHNPLSGPPADPFSGTPADHWGNGAAGIVLPAAEPVGGYTAAQVESAYEKTRALLAAAYLDRKTLLGGQPTAFANLLTSQEATQFLDGLDKTGVDKQGQALSTRGWVMAFPPGAAQLIGSVIRVHGTMRVRTATYDGQAVLDVDTDYIFVYPVEPPHQPTAWMRVVTQASWTVSFADWEGGATSFEPWVDETGGGVAGTACGTTDGYEHPDYPGSPTAKAQPSPSGTPIDPYALGQEQSGGTTSECRATTGT